MSSTSTFVKKLASDDRKTRDAAFITLKKYLSSKSSSKLTLLELEKLWKGLYYSMWMCDRVRAQERLAEELAELYSSVLSDDIFIRAVEAFWVVMIREWPNIDQWRIDKFYMLIRKILRHNFKFLKSHNWDDNYVTKLVDVYAKYPLSGKKEVPAALPYHICDIFLDELELVMFEELENDENDHPKNDNKDSNKLSDAALDIVKDTPIEILISVFVDLSKNAPLKTLREKCREEVLDNQKLKEWNINEAIKPSGKGAIEDEENDEVEEEYEWKGFI